MKFLGARYDLLLLPFSFADFFQAVNLMRANSIGCALWVGMYLHECIPALGCKTAGEFDALRLKMNPFQLLKALRAKGVKLWHGWQLPGWLAVSPPRVGCLHVVFSRGVFIAQLAWNSLTLPEAATESLAAYGNHCQRSNGGSATGVVLADALPKWGLCPQTRVDQLVAIANKQK